MVTIDLSTHLGHSIRLEISCAGTGDTNYGTWAYVDAPDDIPPTATVSRNREPNHNGWDTAPVTVNLTATDNPGGTGVKEIHYSINSGPETIVPGASAPVELTAQGTYDITYFAKDNADNDETPKSLAVKIDWTPPTTTATTSQASGGQGWNNNDITVTLSAIDNLSGVARTEYNLDSAGWVDYTSPISISTEGTYTLLYRSLDKADNLEPAKSLTIRCRQDTTRSLQPVRPG